MPLAAAIIAVGVQSPGSITINTVTAPSGGVAPYTNQLIRGPSAVFFNANVTSPDTTVIPGTTYYYKLTTYDADATFVESNVVKAIAVIPAYYAVQSDIEDWFGIDNVTSWSQLDNNIATADQTRIFSALTYADRQIDRALRTAGYSTPIATSSADFDLLSDIAAEMAGVWLYLARGKQDLGGGETGAAMAGKMDDHRKHADDALTDLINGGIDGTARFTDTSGAPIQIVAGDSVLNGVAADGLPLGWFN